MTHRCCTRTVDWVPPNAGSGRIFSLAERHLGGIGALGRSTRLLGVVPTRSQMRPERVRALLSITDKNETTWPRYPDSVRDDKRRLTYRIRVEGFGPLELLETGEGTNFSIDAAGEQPQWQQWVDRLASFSRFTRFDLRGVGLSDPLGCLNLQPSSIGHVRCVGGPGRRGRRPSGPSRVLPTRIARLALGG